MRILLTNDDGIHAPGLAVLETIASELSRRRFRRRAGDRPVGRRPFAVAQRPVAPARDQPAPLRGQGHADRLRHHGRAADHGRQAARSRAVGGQPRPERRRGRHLFRHHRRRDGGRDARHPGDRPVAGLRRRARAAADRMGFGSDPRRPADSPDLGGRHRARRPRQRQLSALRRRRGQGNRLHPPGTAQRRTHAGRAAARRPRVSRITG